MGDIQLGRHFCLTRPVASLRANHRRHSGSALVVSSTPVNPRRPLPCGSCDSLVFSQDVESASAVPPRLPDEAPAQIAAGRPSEGPGPHVDLSPSPATPRTTADGTTSTRRTEPPGGSPSIGLRTDGPSGQSHRVETAERTPIRAHKDVDHASHAREPLHGSRRRVPNTVRDSGHVTPLHHRFPPARRVPPSRLTGNCRLESHRPNSAPMLTLKLTLTIGVMFLCMPAFAELEPADRVDRYIQEATSYLERKDYLSAIEPMAKLLALGGQHDVALPNEFHFYYAHTLDLVGLHAEAVASVYRYLKLTGTTGEYYREALELLQEASRAETEAKRRFRDCETCPDMMKVPKGRFKMGAPISEDRPSGEEGPLHWVTIARPFAVGAYEVTFDEWDACVSDGGCDGYRPDDEGWGRGRRPVINVSWEDAQMYVAWLTRKTGRKYRLLSESEWEYVARAGSTTAFHTGVTISTSQANYDGNYTYGMGRRGEYRERTTLVGRFRANAYGLYDVHGNVQEWVQDCWHKDYVGAPIDGSAWDSDDCSSRVSRGGSWYDLPAYLRSEYRCGIDPGDRDDDGGFRVARELGAP